MTSAFLDEFERALEAFGLVLPAGGVVADGNIHRVDDAQHHRKRNQAGWYLLHKLPSGHVTGWYGSWWRDRGKQRWSSRHHRTFTAADRKAIAEQKAKIEADRFRHYEEGAKQAARMWMAAKACSSHPYLERKRVQTYGLRVLDETTARSFDLGFFVGKLLLIPVNDLVGNLGGLQWIDANGKKRYTFGTDRSSGTCFVIGTLAGATTVAIVEGYATGATIHEATGWPVVVAFDAGGVEKIAKPLRQLLAKGDADLRRRQRRRGERLHGPEGCTQGGSSRRWRGCSATHGGRRLERSRCEASAWMTCAFDWPLRRASWICR